MTLFRAPIFCTRCYWRPALRFSEALVNVARQMEPDEILSTYKCQRPRCGEIGYVTAAALQRASPIEEPPESIDKAG